MAQVQDINNNINDANNNFEKKLKSFGDSITKLTNGCQIDDNNNNNVKPFLNKAKPVIPEKLISQKREKLLPEIIFDQKLSDSEIISLIPELICRQLPSKYAKNWIANVIKICKPDKIHLCTGSDTERANLTKNLVKEDILENVGKLDNCWIARTDPNDVARKESATFITSLKKRTSIPIIDNNIKGKLGFWKSYNELKSMANDRYPNCMAGRTMYIIPFSMGVIGGNLSKSAIQITDFSYVVLSMCIMTRVSVKCLHVIEKQQKGHFVKCMHSVGCPMPLPKDKQLINNWPCNPSKVMVAHVPEKDEILSFGSAYGGNSLLGKKCFALRIGSTLAQRNNWLAEHMMIAGITNPKGVKKYICAAFPSGCGKTNLAMLTPKLPGWKFECIGDDICWMKFDEFGILRAINPENGFFGVAPGTSMKTNPNAKTATLKNTIFTNVAKTSNDVYWQGGDEISENVKVTTWKNEIWDRKKDQTPAHPNSRFCTPAVNCPVISEELNSKIGVPIDAIIFGGRRPTGIPLIYQSYSWQHGVMVGASMRSEATRAAEYTTKEIMNDPFAMRPFFGYNFGNYLKHWLSLEKSNNKMPEIFHLNLFRKDTETSKFLWPGFGENIRILEWVFNRCGKDKVYGNAVESAIGYLPKKLDTKGLEQSAISDLTKVLHLEKSFLEKEVNYFENYLKDQVADDTPPEIISEIQKYKERIDLM